MNRAAAFLGVLLGMAGVMASGGAASGPRTVEAADFGARGDGVSDDTVALQRALDQLRDSGGGTLRLDPGKTYRLSRHAPRDQGPSLRLGRRVSLDGRGATLVQTDNASYLGADFRTAHPHAITGDVTAGSDHLTVDSTEGYAVGDSIFARIGQNAWDPREPRLTILARIVAIRGRTLTLDRRFGETISGTVTNPDNHRVEKVTGEWRDGSIRNLVLRTVPGIPAEEGINLRAARNVTVENITSQGIVGAGLLAGQFCEGVTATRLVCRENPNPSRQGSFGRMMGWSNCTGVTVSDFTGSWLGGDAIFFIESYSRDIVFRDFRIDDCTPRSGKPVFAFVGQGSSLVMENFRVRSVNAFVETDSGGTPGTPMIGDATYDCAQRPFGMSGRAHYGRLDLSIAGQRTVYDFARQLDVAFTFPLRDGLRAQYRAPAGILTRLEVLAPPANATKALESFQVGRWGTDGKVENGSNHVGELRPGRWTGIANADVMLGTVAGSPFGTDELRRGGCVIQVSGPAGGAPPLGAWVSIHAKVAPVISD